MDPAPSPEIVPALDESRPQIGPNLAVDPDFCKVVLSYTYRNHVYPYVLQQQPYWPVWRRIDDAWRVRGKAYDLDISVTDNQTRVTNPDFKGGVGGGITDPKDGYSSKVYPSTLHEEVTAITDLHMSIAWSDGLPVQARMPKRVYEHPLYNPNQQTVDAANQLLQDCAEEIDLEREDRKGRGSFAKYGHAWAHTDWEYEEEVIPCSFPIPQDPQQQAIFQQAMAQRFGNQPPQVTPGQFGLVATYQQRVIGKMRTAFRILRVDDVFVDQTMPADRLENQLCVAVRSRTNRASLFGNDYDPNSNPFGYLNCQQAMQDSNPHWQMEGPSNLQFQQELQKKWGLSTTGLVPPKDAIKQKWTMYVMLGIYQDPRDGSLQLDDGSGITCPTCSGRGKIAAANHPAYDGSVSPDQEQVCPQCEGRMRFWITPERYVVEAYGNLDTSAAQATCLRIQKNYTPNGKDRIPVLYTCALPEDTAGAIPLAKSEAALKSVDQEATSLMQWFGAKDYLRNPSWLLPEGADTRIDYNQPNKNIECNGDPRSYIVNRMAVDPTANILPFMGEQRQTTIRIMGANDTLLGEIQSGRRSASEIQNAYDASKTPIVIGVNMYGKDMLAKWAQQHIDNIEAWADRDWIRQKTGRETFGKVQLFAAFGTEFVARQASIGNFQYMAQLIAPVPGANLQPIFEAMCQLMRLPINPNEVLPDNGVKKARADGMRIAFNILGGKPAQPPMPSDPHQIYITIFEEVLKDEHWQKDTPETMPLLQQRLMIQTQMAMQQQEAQMMAQQHQLALAHAGASLGQHFKPKQQPAGQNGNQPAMSNTPPATAGGSNQQIMGSTQS